MAPAAGGLQSTAIDVRQARFIRFSQWPVIRTIVDATVGDVIKRISATSGAQNAFASEPVDPAFEQRLLSVGMTPDNLDAFVSDELQFNNTSRWVDENVPQIRVPSVIIGALGDQIVEIDHVRRLAKTLPDTELITVDGNHVISQPSVRRCAPALTTPPWGRRFGGWLGEKRPRFDRFDAVDRKAHPEVVATQIRRAVARATVSSPG